MSGEYQNAEFKPTSAMKKAAAQGLTLHNGGMFPVTPKAITIGKKIAAGQHLTASHVEDMAHFHLAHNTCPAEDCEDLLWGGPAGGNWAKAKLISQMRTGLAEENIDFEKMIGDKDLKLSLEVFSTLKLDEPIELGEDDKGYIWAPILRSGMLATRPGPNGEKLDEPLIFIPGHSENQRKEIGLQDVVDAFHDKAIEYVTLPTTHDNNVLDNTGFVRDLKIVDSKKYPGEKVILAAHDFTEPDIKGKVQRGTIPSRSSGLLYDYKNTTTGKEYPVVLDHTCLTHKPWMGGMAAYGSLEHDDLSDRTIISMLLSEKPLTVKDEPEKKTPTKLAQEITKPDQTTKEDAELKSEFLADIQWGDEPSYRDIESQIQKILDGFTGDEIYPSYYVIDCLPDKVLIKVNYGIGSDDDAWVAPYKCTDGKVELAPFADWIDVQKKWVNDTEDPDKDREQLDKLKMSDKSTIIGLYLGVPQAKRDRAKAAGHALPDGSYPIENAHDLHSAAVLAASGHGNVSAAKALIRRRAKDLGVDINGLPGFGPKKETKSNMSDDPLKRASERRSINAKQPLGGQMTLLAMSEEKMELLGLSDEAKEFQRQQNKEIQTLSLKLAETQKKEKETRVANRITELKGEGFDAFPGLLVEIEKTMMSDDGDIAVKLQLSDSGHEIEVPETATELAERFIKALPRKDGKIDLGEQANKLESPIADRPELTVKDPNEKDKPKDANALLAEWEAADSTLAKDPAFASLKLSENGAK